MKKFFTIFILLSAMKVFAQNGFTSCGAPSVYSTRNALAIDNNGNKWVAFQKIGLGKFDGSNWTMFDISNSPLPSDTVKALAVDASNNLWIGTYKGLAMFNGTSWSIFTNSNSSLPDNNIVSLAANGNTIWAGTNLGSVKINGSAWTTYNASNSAIANDTVQCFSFDQSGNTFFGTKNGLSKLNGSTWTTFNKLNSGLLSNNILSLFFYQGNLWIGTMGGGVHKYYSNTIDNINVFYESCNVPLTSGNIYSITSGPAGGIICSGVSGYPLLELFPAIRKMRSYSRFPNLMNATSKCFLANDNNGLLFFLNATGSNNILVSLNASGYNGLDKGYYTDNMSCLDINNVEAMILNRGDLHWDLANAHYEVPKGSGINSIFGSAIWLGGIDPSGQLHVAAQTYRQTGEDFWPGPLDTINGECDSTTAYEFDRIWKINRFKIEEFKYYFAKGDVQNGKYIPDYDIISWPAHGNISKGYSKNLAPFVDVNGDGIYNPMQDGDYPLIRGDQELFTIFNDNLVPPGIHTSTGGNPMKVEIHLSAYAYTCPNIADSLKELNYTTFYHYEIFNRSTLQYDSAHIAYWQDFDLGCYTDDFVGCLKDKNFGFAYNGDNDDEVNCTSPGYGLNPPLLSTTILRGPLANANDGIDNNNNGIIDEAGEENLMTSFLYYNNTNTTGQGNPAGAQHFYNFSKGIWGDGKPMIDCKGDTTKFFYEGHPYDPTSCAETNSGTTPNDRRFVMGCGPFTFLPNSKIDFDFGIIFSRDTNLTWGTVPYYQQGEQDVATIQNWYAASGFPSCLLLNMGIEDDSTAINALNVFPNPSESFINVSYRSKTKNPQYEIIDVSGKIISTSSIQNSGEQINISKLPQGIYLLKIKDGEKILSKKFIKE